MQTAADTNNTGRRAQDYMYIQGADVLQRTESVYLPGMVCTTADMETKSVKIRDGNQKLRVHT